MLNNAPVFKANGTISPSVFVKQDTSGDNLLVQAAGGDPPIGVSQLGMKRAPGITGSDTTVAAASGDVIQIYSLGDVCQLICGGTVTRGDYLKPNGSGQGVTASSGDVVGAYALQSGTTSALILVQVLGKGSKMP